jgi:tetratricopeptide (TPR) repeat protein
MRLLPVLLLTATAAAQIPDHFTNLQVLRKDIPKQELTSFMRGFVFSLGVRCVNCHDVADYASDAKETKRKARAMMRMVEAVNRDTIAKLEPATANRIDCATCHHGLDKPRALQSVLAEELEKKDLASTISLYRDLRKRYYGGAQYDFSETSLNLLVEGLGAKKTKEAAAFMELNAELNPLTAWGKSLLAMAHRANGDTDKAIADFQAIVEANPNDSWAKQQLEALKSGKR